MCLLGTTAVSIERLPAFKVFAIKNDKLVSAFRSSLAHRSMDLSYGTGRIQCNPTSSTFFAFKTFGTAVGVARGGSRTWNFYNENLLVLPVTLYDVILHGYLREVSDDPQCLDVDHESYEAKGIEVHDSEENRNAFYRAVLQHSHRLSGLEKTALERFLKSIGGI